ncbi:MULTISPECIES: DUF1700 domain-containing protein [Romboutsia]|uniref:DUF1700 domain-containing protein n=1 Tax=Romboutsia TaxID=1501226 RepID=UPI00159EEDAD|nr:MULTISPECIES: DUF1700 domain-containing protein [Romboutsia]
MNRAEFLDILRDYLKGSFSEEEIGDILRDYEEYFLDGTIEGKSDIEIIKSLGSPKTIASELIAETKNKEEDNNIRLKINIIKSNFKRQYINLKDRVSEKLTLDIENNDQNKRKIIQLGLSILSLIVFIPRFLIVLFLSVVGIILVSLIGLYVATMPIIMNFISQTHEVMGLYVFMSIAFVGGQILAWQIYIFIISIYKTSVNRYKSWMKTRKLYINASKKKEANNKEENSFKEGEEDDE